MRGLRCGLAILLFAAALVGARPRTGRDAEVAAAPVARPARVARPSPMTIEIRAVLDRERDALASLHAKLRAARDEGAARELEREVERVRLGTEVSLLRVQAKHARLAGREAVAAHLEGAIRALLSPPVVLPERARPVPVLNERKPGPDES